MKPFTLTLNGVNGSHYISCVESAKFTLPHCTK